MLKMLPALGLLWAAIAAPGADAPATFKVGEFTFTRPAKWEWIQSKSEVYKVRLKLAGQGEKESTEVKFVHEAPRPESSVEKSSVVELGLPTTEGRLNDRSKPMADRLWVELTGPNFQPRFPTDQTNVAGHKLTYLYARPISEIGTLRSFVTLRPVTRQTIAFVESKEGNVLITFTGEMGLVDDSEADFRKMIETAAAGK
jgi:hypothetical protein